MTEVIDIAESSDVGTLEVAPVHFTPRGAFVSFDIAFEEWQKQITLAQDFKEQAPTWVGDLVGFGAEFFHCDDNGEFVGICKQPGWFVIEKPDPRTGEMMPVGKVKQNPPAIYQLAKWCRREESTVKKYLMVSRRLPVDQRPENLYLGNGVFYSHLSEIAQRAGITHQQRLDLLQECVDAATAGKPLTVAEVRRRAAVIAEQNLRAGLVVEENQNTPAPPIVRQSFTFTMTRDEFEMLLNSQGRDLDLMGEVFKVSGYGYAVG